MSGFGRKGLDGGPQLTPGQAMAMRAMPVPSAQPEAEAISPQLAAFLASERSRGPAPEPSLSDVATHYSAKQPPRLGQQPVPPLSAPRADKSMVIAYLLWWFTGCFGGHRFYLRAYKSAWWQLGQWPAMIIVGIVAHNAGVGGLLAETLVPLWFVTIIIWFIADAFLIPGLTRKANGPRPELVFS